jgi:hypothetical protein
LEEDSEDEDEDSDEEEEEIEAPLRQDEPENELFQN